MKYSQLCVKSAWALFSCVGIYRGINYYNYSYQNKIKNYKTHKMQYPKTTMKIPKYYVSDAITNGCIGFIIYCNPITMPYAVYKEILRLEINIRGYDDEKETDKYHDLL